MKIHVFLKEIFVKDVAHATSHFSLVKNNYTYHTGAYRTRVLHISDLERLNFEKKTCRAPREEVTAVTEAVITMPRPVTAVMATEDGFDLSWLVTGVRG